MFRWNSSALRSALLDRRGEQAVSCVHVCRVWDQDVFSADDSVGVVLLDLNYLLTKENATVAGWFPIFDTLKGMTRVALFIIALLRCRSIVCFCARTQVFAVHSA